MVLVEIQEIRKKLLQYPVRRKVVCEKCGRVWHADANAALNILLNRRATDGARRRSSARLDCHYPDPGPRARRFDEVPEHPEGPEVVDEKIPRTEVHVLPDARQIFDEESGHAVLLKATGDLRGQGHKAMSEPAGAA